MSNYPTAPIVKNGDRIGFLGDSITNHGHELKCGYVNLVMQGLKDAGITAENVNAGIGGHKAPDMLARVDADVLDHDVQIMTLSCGVNDVWHAFYPTPAGVALPDYQRDITAIIDRAQAKGVKVLLFTATMIMEDENGPENTQLIPYNEFLRKLAVEKDCILIDLNELMHKEVAAIRKKFPGIKGNTITIDGVHMNPMGNIMMAKEILKAMGIDEKSIAASAEKWLELDYTYGLVISMTAGEFIKVAEKGFAQGMDFCSFARQSLKDLAK